MAIQESSSTPNSKNLSYGYLSSKWIVSVFFALIFLIQITAAQNNVPGTSLNSLVYKTWLSKRKTSNSAPAGSNLNKNQNKAVAGGAAVNQPAAITITASDVWTSFPESRAFSFSTIKLCIANDSVKWAKGPPPEIFFPQPATKIPAAILNSFLYTVCKKGMTIDALATTDTLGVYFPVATLTASISCTNYRAPAQPPVPGNYTVTVDQFGNSNFVAVTKVAQK
jgi:hypothetical protein